MSRNINIAKVWNPNNYQDIGTWYNNTGSYGSSHNFNTVLTENPLFFVEIYNTNSTSRAYRYTENPYYGFSVLSRDYSYPVVDKILFAALITYNTTDRVHAPFKIEFYTNYNREATEIHNPIQEQTYGIPSFFINLQPEEWTAPSITTTQSRVSYITSSYSAHKIFPGDDINTIWNEKWWGKNGSSYGWQNNYQLDNFILNINNPYFPVFDNEQDLLDYLDDYENEQKASKALNYYDMSNDLSHSDERYKYKNLKDIMSSYKNKFENSNIYDFSSIDKEILTPLNNLILTYKGVNYDEKITELKNKYNKKLSEYMSLSNMTLIDFSDTIVREINMPYNEPLTPYLSYSGYTTTEFNKIKTYVEDKILEEYDATRDYLLVDISGYSTSEDRTIFVVVGDNNGNNEISIRGSWRAERGRLLTKYYHMSSRDVFYKALGGFYGEYFKFRFNRTESIFHDYVSPTIGYLDGDEYHGGGRGREGSLNTININTFNDYIPFYASADFYVSGMSNMTVEPDEPVTGSFNISYIPEDYANKEITMLAVEGRQLYNSEIIPLNDVIKEIYTYSEPHYAYIGDYLYPYHILYYVHSSRSLMFKATPNEDPYANLPTTGPGLTLVKPVLALFNRYEMSNINGWDGNKLKVTDGYLLAPQVGAGIKHNGLFTGIVIGTKQIRPNSNENQRIGMFGFRDGVQSIFLNAEDGSAIFGMPGKGQITIDPLRDKGLLYSGNYWKDYNTKDGKPKSYSSSNLNGQGMLIDLTTPEIRFGNGNFVVTKDGYVTARGGGSIAGWRIGNSELYSNVTKGSGRLTLDSGSITLYAYELPANYGTGSVTLKIYCLTSSESQTSKIFYIKDEDNIIKNNFKFSYTEGQGQNPGTGFLEVFGSPYKQYNLGDLNLTSDTLIYNYVSGKPVVDTASNYQYPGKIYSHSHDSLAATNQGFYLSYDGFSIGSKFKVNSSGLLEAEDVNLSGTINVRGDGASKIGSWTVNNDNLYSRITRTSVPAGTFDITIGSDGNLFGKKLISTDPETGVETWEPQWEIRRDGDAYFKNIYGTVPSGKTLNILGSLEVTGTADITTLNVDTIKINNVALSSHTAKAVTSVSSADIKDGDGNTVRVLTGISLTDSITFVTK